MKVEITNDEATSVLNLYKNNTKIDPDTGVLAFGNLPVIWARPIFIANIYMELESLVGQSAFSVLKRIGNAYGTKFYNMLKNGDTQLFINDKEKLYRYTCSETQAIGWGRISIEDNDDGIIIVTSNGFAAGRYYAALDETRDTPVDAYFLGYFEGFFSEMHGKRFTGDEVDCVAKGDSQCKFVFKVA